MKKNFSRVGSVMQHLEIRYTQCGARLPWSGRLAFSMPRIFFNEMFDLLFFQAEKTRFNCIKAPFSNALLATSTNTGRPWQVNIDIVLPITVAIFEVNALSG
jgi:hypothetical protein